jgi:hypothetical protein
MVAASLVAHVHVPRGKCCLVTRSFSRRKLFGSFMSINVTCGACSPMSNKNGMQHLITEGSAFRNWRQIHDGPNGASSSTVRQRLGELRRNGIPEIVFGSIILALAGIDFAIRVRNDKPREEIHRQLEREVLEDEATSRKEDKRMLEEGIANTLKFQGIIRRVPQNFDGHKCLQNVKVGDVVGVLEECVGPGGQYNLCMIERIAALKESSDDDPRCSIGWFPCSCLEKLE